MAGAPVAAARRPVVTERPVQPLPRASQAVAPVLIALRLAAAEPIFAGRRRE